MDAEEKSSNQSPACDRPCLLDPGQQDRLVVQVKKLTGESGLLSQVIEHTKAANELARNNNKQLRMVLVLLAVFGVVLAVVAVSGVNIVNDFIQMERRLDATTRKIDDLADRLGQTEDKIDEVKKDTDTIREDRENQPRVELVEEKDPAKAVKAPIKVRIIPPRKKDAPSPPSSAGIEVAVPSDSSKDAEGE